jgi:hypothetical protein
MPSSSVRNFIDPDMYFSGIRNLQIEGIVTKRGEFHAEATRIDLHRLWMHRFDEGLPRIMYPIRSPGPTIAKKTQERIGQTARTSRKNSLKKMRLICLDRIRPGPSENAAVATRALPRWAASS